MKQYETQLTAEDGVYTKEHETLEDAMAYVELQMGYKPTITNKGPFGWTDGWGRQIYIRNNLNDSLV